MHTRCTQMFFGAALLTVLAHANAQAPSNPPFAHGVHYTFERLVLSRTVDDKFDKGNIQLISYVYKPLRRDSQAVVLFSHGSTAGWTVSPREPVFSPPSTVVQYFIDRGITVVAPMRRGVAESGGQYMEECELQAGKCTPEEQTAIGEAAITEAMRDTDVVLKHIQSDGRLGKTKRILFSGISRGGFLSVLLAAAYPSQCKAVVNFVGGWFSISESWPADVNDKRRALQAKRLTAAGKNFSVPTLWIYAHRDPFYAESVTREFFSAFTAGGGRGEYYFVSDPQVPNGHAIHRWPALWQPKVNQYLDSLPPCEDG